MDIRQIIVSHSRQIIYTSILHNKGKILTLSSTDSPVGLMVEALHAQFIGRFFLFLLQFCFVKLLRLVPTRVLPDPFTYPLQFVNSWT